MHDHNILRLHAKGVLVTVNSDDPAYFGGYMNENYEAIAENLELSQEELKTLAKKQFQSLLFKRSEKATFYRHRIRVLKGLLPFF